MAAAIFCVGISDPCMIVAAKTVHTGAARDTKEAVQGAICACDGAPELTQSQTQVIVAACALQS